jgi:predicted nuclease of predicted toxin-antitoxin system
MIDVGVGRAVEDWLRAAGYDVLAVRDLDPGMSDENILARAAAEQRLVITMDKDFGELVYRSGHAHAGVLLLRLEDESSAHKVAVVEQIFTPHANQLQGRFAVYQKGILRIRS